MNEGRPEPASTARADARDQRPDADASAPEPAAPASDHTETVREDSAPDPTSTTERQDPEAVGQPVPDEAASVEAGTDEACGSRDQASGDQVSDGKGSDGFGDGGNASASAGRVGDSEASVDELGDPEASADGSGDSEASAEGPGEPEASADEAGDPDASADRAGQLEASAAGAGDPGAEGGEAGRVPTEAEEHTVILPAGGVVRTSRGEAADDDERTTILSKGSGEFGESRTAAPPVPAGPPAPALPDWLNAPNPASAAPPQVPQQPPPGWAQSGQYPGLGHYPGLGQYPTPAQHPHQAWMPPAWGQAQPPGAPPPGTQPAPPYGQGYPGQPPPWQPPTTPTRPGGPKKAGPIGLWIALGVVFALLVGSVLIWFAVSDPPPQQVAAEVADQLDKAEGTRYQGKVSAYTAGEFDVDMTVAKNGDAYGTISKDGNRAEFAVVGNDTLIKADANWWKSGSNAAKADRLSDIWLKNPQDVPTLGAVLKSPSELAQQFRGGAAFWTEEREQTIDGVEGRTFKSSLIGTVVISDESTPRLLSYLPSISLYTKTPLKILAADPAQLAGLRAVQSTAASAKSFGVRLYEQPKLSLSIEPPKLCTTPTCTATIKLSNTGDLPASGTIEVRMNGDPVQTIPFHSAPGSDQNFSATSGNPAAGVGGYRTMYWTARISTN